MIHTFVARTNIKRGNEVGIDAGGQLCLTFPHVTEAVGVARRALAAGELATFSHDEDTDIHSYAILVSDSGLTSE